jgi:hypothetical protein
VQFALNSNGRWLLGSEALTNRGERELVQPK